MGTVFSLEGIKTGQYSQELELLSWHIGGKGGYSRYNTAKSVLTGNIADPDTKGLKIRTPPGKDLDLV
jgi:hypothetical protein